MAYVTRKASDLSGTEATEEAFATLVVRRHAAIEAPVVLDVLPDEVKDLKEAGDLVQLELKLPGESEAKVLVVKRADFDKLAPDMAKVLASARGTKGRPKGSTNGNGTSA